ncbi:MAG: hypothetical protein ACRCU2_33000 [Planktothrix sp.]
MIRKTYDLGVAARGGFRGVEGRSGDRVHIAVPERIPNPVGKSRFSLLARAGGLCPCSPTLQGVGFYRPITTGFCIRFVKVGFRF